MHVPHLSQLPTVITANFVAGMKPLERAYPTTSVIVMVPIRIALTIMDPFRAHRFVPRNHLKCGMPVILILDTGVTTATPLSAMTRSILRTSGYNANVTEATFIVIPTFVRCLVL